MQVTRCFQQEPVRDKDKAWEKKEKRLGIV